MKKHLYYAVLQMLLIVLGASLSAWAAGTTIAPATLGSKTLLGFGGSAGAHEFFLQEGSSWKGDLTGIGAGPTWSMVILDIDATGVTGPADRIVYFNLQDADNGSHFKNLGISCRLDASGAAGGTLLQCYQQFTSEGLSSHGLNIGELTASDFDLRFDFTKAVTGDGWTVTPYFRLSGEAWTLFFDGAFTATVGGIDFDAGKIAVGFDSGADGSLSFGNLYVSGPAGDVYVDDGWIGLPDGTPVQFPGQSEYRTVGIDAFDEIQEGIDNVSGSTVNVAAGTYTANVVIGKALDLIGAGAATTIIDGNNVGNTVTITASDVSVSGFKVIGGYSNGGSVFTPYGGVVINGNGGSSALTGITIEDNVVESNDGVGVFVSAAGDGGAAGNVVIRNCDILNNAGGAGISLTYPLYSGPWGSYDEWRRPKNILVEADSIAGNSDYGIYISAGKDNVIRSNDISTSSKYGLQLAASMTYTEIPCEYTTVDSNEIYNSGRNGVKLTSFNQYNTFTANNIYNNGFSGTSDYYKYGFLFQDGNDNLIQNNTITGNALGGLYLWGKGDPSYTWYTTTDNAVSGNTVANHTAAGAQGIYVPANYGNPNSGFLNSTISGNSITGNLAYGLENADATQTINATGNWWGDASGPYHATTNIGGSGDGVSDDVAYAPWWGADYVGDPHTSPWTWYLNTTNTIQAAIDAASPGDIVNVLAGTYAERININKSLNLRGAQHGVDPTQPGARTNPAVESTLDISGLSAVNPNVAVEVPGGVTDVTVSGFTLIGSPTSHYADESIVRCWDDDLTIVDNIMDGYLGILYKGNDNLTVRRNRVTANKNGVVVQPNPATGVILADNQFMLGSSPAGDESGMYLTFCSSCSVTGNTANGFINAKGIAGSSLDHVTVSGNTFDGDKDAISFWGNTTFITISGNLLTNSLRYGISIKGQDIEITGNTIAGSADAGVNIDKHTLATERVSVTDNSITGNTNYGLQVNTALVTEMVTATGNWWGDASGPYHAVSNATGTGNAVTDEVDYSPWWGGDYLDDPHADPWAWYLNTSNSSTVQEGIDGASPGDTVNVRAGVYNENPNVNKGELILLGEDKATTFIMTTTSSGMAINASSVTMSGFTVKQNNAAVVQKDLYIGLSAWVSDVTVRDCIFDGTGSTKSGSMGIQVRQADGVTIEGVQSFGWTGYGVNVYNAGPPFADDVLINDSYFHDNGYFGVSIDRSTNVRVRDCTITGAGGSGVAVFEDSGKPATGAEITGCTIQGPFSNNGILVVADSALIQGNEIFDISDVGTRGIRITTAYWPYYSADGNTVINNFIHDNNIGLQVDFGTYDEPTGNVIFDNRFTNHTVAVEASECTQPVDASANWWGSNDATTVGALMSGMADYTPWLHDSTDTSLDPGFQGDFSHLHVDDNSAQAGTTDRIEEGIDMVTGSIVEVEPGTYGSIIFGTDFNMDGLTVTGDTDTIPTIEAGVRFLQTADIDGLAMQYLYIKGIASGGNAIFDMDNPGAVNDFVMDHCVIDGEDVSGRIGFAGQNLSQSFTISNSEFKNILGWAVMDIESGSGDGASNLPFTTVGFADNQVHDCNGSVALRGKLSPDQTGVVNAYGNVFSNIGGNEGETGEHWAALEVNHAVAAHIYENTIDDVAEGEWGEGQAFQFWDIDTLHVHDNHITNNHQGIFIFGGGAPPYGGPYAVPAGGISHNNISGNTQYGVSVEAAATGGPLNAGANWWGHASGPEHATNPGGTGDIVSDNVDYSPWWGGNYVGDPHTTPWVWQVNDVYGSSIGEAIAEAADGDTVNISPGTYEEQIVITQNGLEVLGSGSGSDPDSNTVVMAPDGMSWYFTTSADNYPIIGIDAASGVGIRRLRVDGAGRGNTNSRFVGVGFWNGDGDVDRCAITNVKDTPFSGAQHGVSIYAYNDGSKGSYDIEVTHTTIDEFQKTAMALSGEGLTVTVDSCTVVGAGPTAVTAQNGVQIGYDATGSVTDCDISGIEYTGTGWSASGILLYYPAAGMALAGNQVSGCQGALNAYFADGLAMNGNQWVDNEFVFVWGGDGGAILGDQFTANEQALYIADATNLSLDENTFDDNEFAVIVDGLAAGVSGNENQIVSSTACGVYVQPYGSDEPTGLVFHSNNISGNAFGFSNTTSNMVDAEENWWGDPTGPTTSKGPVLGTLARPSLPAILDGSVTTLDRPSLTPGRRERGTGSGRVAAKGSGDAVTSLVDYSPWWGGNYVGDPHTSPWQWWVDISNGSGIQEGIDAAAEGDTVNATPHLYEEQVVISKDDLALLGAGCGTDPDSASIIKSPVNLIYSFNTGSHDNYPIVGIDGATGVTIEDFSINGAGRGNANSRFVGIGFWNADGHVNRCCLTGVRDDPFSGAQHGVAVYAYNNSGGPYDMDVTETTVDDFQKTAMALSGANLTVDVTGCAIAGAGSTSVTAQNGIQIGFGAGGTISDCSVEGIAYTGSGWTASGMLFYNGTTVDIGGTCTLTDCQASIIYQETDGSAAGVVVNSAGIESEEGISIRDYAYEKGFSGDCSFRPAAPLEEGPTAGREIKGAPTTVVLSDLHLTGNHGVSTYGVAAWSLGDDVDVTLTDSEIRDWEIGLVAYEDVSAVELMANHNDISSNDMGYWTNAAAMQNAMSNWWGDFHGPLQAATNPTATGDEVSDNVDYSPWWTNSYVGDSHADPWSWGLNTSNSSGLQEGIDSASVADTVNAMADTYEENIIVNKTLVLRGAQAGVDARGRTADEALITASSGHLVDIQADDVVMDGFQVTGTILAEKLIRLVSAGAGLQLLNNILNGTAEDLLWFGTSAPGVLIQQNQLDATSVTGTYGLAELDASGVFSGLAIMDNDCYGGEFFAGNKSYNSTGLVMSGNSFDGTVVKLSSQFENALIANNTLINNGYTNLQAGLRNSTVTGNSFHNANPLPWVTVPSHAVMLWGNQYGLTPSEDVLLENNFFYFNEVSAPDEISNGIRILSGADAATITLFDNSFVDGGAQASALAVVNETGGVINASGNWWSSSDHDAVKSVSGGGIDVDYTPWLDSGLDTGDPGFHGDFSTLWVDDDSPQSGITGRVQEGVDRVTGSLVHVVTGTYEEQVEIDKTLTLLGFGADSTFIHSPVTLAKHFTTGADNYPVIFVHDADDVEIKDLTVDGLGRGNGNYRFEGIAYYNAGGTVLGCHVEDIREEPYSGNQHGVAIYAYTDTAVARTLNVTGCAIAGYQKNAMALSGAHLTAHVDSCQVTGYGPADFIAQNGIQLGYGATGTIGTISPNTVSGHSYTPHDWAASGILLYATSGTVQVADNIVSENSEGIYAIDASAVITGNQVSATQAGTGVADYWAVLCDPGMDRQTHRPMPFDDFRPADRGKGTFTYVVEDNTIDGDDGSGSVGLDIWSDGSDDVVVTGSHNTITDFDIGVQVDEESAGLVSSVLLNWNSFYDNVSYGVYNAAALTVDARYCWWGDVSGPFHPALNSGGLGNEVSDRVLFDPWLGAADETDLVWSTFMGGGACDQSYDIAVDASGSVYVTGYTNSLNFPTTAGAYSESHSGGSDVFVAKLDPTGSALVYATFLGGSDVEIGHGIAVGGSGSAYVTGLTESSDFPTTAGAHDESYNGGGDVFVAMLDPTGSTLDFATFLGGSDADQGCDVTVGAGGVFLTGSSKSVDFPVTGAAYDIIHNGGADAFVLQLNSAGTALIYSSYLGGAGDDEGRGMVLNNAGNVYLVGSTESPDFPTTTGAYDRIHNGGDDVFTTKMNLAGSTLIFSTFVGGAGDDRGWGIDLDVAANVYLAGQTQSNDFPATGGVYDETYNGTGDAFVLKLNQTGSGLEYASFLGEGGEDWARDVAVDNIGHAYLTGFTGSEDFPTTVGVFGPTYHGGTLDAFVARISPAGNGLDYASFLGGNDVEEGHGIALDGTGYVHICGYTRSADFPTTPGVFDMTYNGGTRGDAFVVKLDVGVVLDKTPPQAIADLTATLDSGAKSYWGNIYLSWTEPYDNIGVDYYIVYRSTLPHQLGDSVAATTSLEYLDPGVAGNPNVNHYYIVKAVDAVGNKSPESNQVGEFDRRWSVKLSN